MKKTFSLKKPSFQDSAETVIWCPLREYQRPLFDCLACKKFPCSGNNEQHFELLKQSLFTELKFSGFLQRRSRMHIFLLTSGELQKAPENFDPEHPELALLENVEEIYCINKVLIKQVKLVPKSKEEIQQIRAQKSGTQPVSKKNQRQKSC